MPNVIQQPNIKQYAVHHTAVSRLASKTQLYSVDRFHKGKWNMKSTLGWYVAYNYFIDVDGTITECRAVGEETIANRGHNCDVIQRCDTISICLAGDFNSELATDAQVVSLRKLAHKLEAEYAGIQPTFHRDIQGGRTCPGILFTEDYMQKRVLQEGIVESADDVEKRKQIAQLFKIIDTLRGLLRRLSTRKLV